MDSLGLRMGGILVWAVSMMLQGWYINESGLHPQIW
nr:MAG TPA: hypothetical protein [Caudoviricetes sp.]